VIILVGVAVGEDSGAADGDDIGVIEGLATKFSEIDSTITGFLDSVPKDSGIFETVSC